MPPANSIIGRIECLHSRSLHRTAARTTEPRLGLKARCNRYVFKKLDSFSTNGPNGLHTCTVCDLVGTSIQNDVFDSCKDDRLLGKTAKRAALQTLRGLQAL